MRRYRRNADTRMRDLERRAAAGDVEAMAAYDRELWRTGKAIRYYAERLLEDFVEDLRAFRSYTRLSHEFATPVLEGLEGEPASLFAGEATVTTTRLVASPGGAEGHGAMLAIPGRNGVPRGYILSMRVMNEQARWGRASRVSIQDVARAEKAGRALPMSTTVQVCVALGGQTKDPFSSPVHPLYFFHRNERRWLHHSGARPRESLIERRVPSRMFCSRILALDLDTPENALSAIERGLTESFEDMNIRLGWVDRILDQARRGVGSLDPQAVRAYVRSLPGSSPGFRTAAEVLQTAFGPVIGAAAPGRVKPTIRAWNIAGEGMLEAALLCLGEWLQRNHRAVIQEVRVDPYNQESGYFVRGYMSVTSTRARRTRNPVTFEVDWDRMNGAWADRGDAWIGNEIPPGGRWKISMVGSPATAQEMVRPAETWIKAVFPDSEILVAAWHERGSYGRPDYRPSR